MILLDTHIFVRLAEDSPKLGTKVRQRIDRAMARLPSRPYSDERSDEEPSEGAAESEGRSSVGRASLGAVAPSGPEASGSAGPEESEPHATPKGRQMTMAAQRTRPIRKAA